MNLLRVRTLVAKEVSEALRDRLYLTLAFFLPVLLMLVFTFIGAAASYRAGAHMSVAMITDRLPARQRQVVGILSQLLMGTICLFMTIWGSKLCLSTWNQFMSAIPTLRVGITYMPIPIGGLLTLVFVVEKLVLGDQSNRRVVRFDLVEESEGAA